MRFIILTYFGFYDFELILDFGALSYEGDFTWYLITHACLGAKEPDEQR